MQVYQPCGGCGWHNKSTKPTRGRRAFSRSLNGGCTARVFPVVRPLGPRPGRRGLRPSPCPPWHGLPFTTPLPDRPRGIAPGVASPFPHNEIAFRVPHVNGDSTSSRVCCTPLRGAAPGVTAHSAASGCLLQHARLAATVLLYPRPAEVWPHNTPVTRSPSSSWLPHQHRQSLIAHGGPASPATILSSVVAGPLSNSTIDRVVVRADMRPNLRRHL